MLVGCTMFFVVFLANFTIGAQCVENLLPRKSLLSEIETHGDASHILSFEIWAGIACQARKENPKIYNIAVPLSVQKHIRHTTLTSMAFDHIYNKIPKMYHSVRAFCRCSMSATPISWAMTLAGMVRLVTEHHNAIFYTLPHYLIAILPHPPTCYVRAVWKYGYGHFYALARALIPAFPPSYNAQKYFTVKIHPQFSILHPLSCRRTFVAATHIQDPAGWKETHFPLYPNHTYLGSLVSR